MMRNLVRVLLVSTALVAAPVSSAFAISAAVQANIDALPNAAAVNAAIAALQAAALSTAPDAAAAATVAAQNLVAALGTNATLLNTILVDVAADIASAGGTPASIQRITTAFAGIGVSVSTSAIVASAQANGMTFTTAELTAIGAVTPAAPGGLATGIDGGTPASDAGPSGTPGGGTPVSPT